MASWRPSPFMLGIATLSLALAAFASPARAQTDTASIRGVVFDPSGAVVPDAMVRLVDVDRGSGSATITGAGGRYAFPSVRPGQYRIEVEKAGFKIVRLEAITVNVLDSLEHDMTLELGTVVDSVRVDASAVRANTSGGAVSTVIDQQFVENLPLNGRTFQSLISMTPGVVMTVTAFDDQGQFSVNGQRADANYFTVDGVSANFGVTGYFPMVQSAGGALPALSASGGTNSLVSVDAMQEFRIQTSSFAPEFGRTPGGQISIVTRSGSNALRGSLFEYFRTSALDASDWFVNANHLAKPEDRMNDFGGVLGGPVRTDKTFFFVSYEGLRLHQPSSQQSAVPDTASRLQAPAAMRPYLNAYPVANGPSLGAGLAQFNASYSDPSTLNASSVRVDHRVGSDLTVFGRYTYSPSTLEQRGPAFASARVLSAVNTLSSTVHTATGGLTTVIKAMLTNDLRANYSVHRVTVTQTVDSFGGAVPIPDSALFPGGYSSTNAGFLFYITGAGEYVQGKLGTDDQRQFNLVDNLSLIKGGHQLKAGVDYRWLAPSSSPFEYRQYAQFSGVTAAPGGALSGTAQIATAGAFQPNSLRVHNYSLYGQDHWTIKPRLTTTFGLRWDVNPPLTGKDAQNDPYTVVGLDRPATLALAPRGTPLYQTTYGNLAPRLGIAYQRRESSRWDTVIRGGVGVFYDLGYGSLGGTTSYFPYFANTVLSGPVPFPLSAKDAAPPAFSLSPPVSIILVADPHLKLPRTYQWNVALEQSIGAKQSLSTTYVGAVGRDLLRVTNLSNANSDFAFVDVTDNSATSDYHAVQVKFQRRLSRGFQAMASYTLAHSTDDASTDAFATYLNTAGAAGASADLGDSDFDIRHAFTAGVTYALPSPQSGTVLRQLLSDWSVDALILARSAPPVNVVGMRTSVSGTALYARPNVNPGVAFELYAPQYAGGKIFNAAAFAATPPGQQGTFGRNVLRGFGASQADIALQRSVPVTGSVSLRVRVEAFNIFNVANFGSPNNNLTDPLFGHSTQTLANSLGSGGANGGLSPLYQIGGPRSIQLAVRLQF